MIERTYAMTVRETPKSVNSGGGGARVHWAKAHKEKMRWEGLYAVELLAARVPKSMYFCTVTITLRFKNRNRRDVENYRHPVVKPLLDAMVKGGWLADDTEENVKVGDMTIEYPDEWDTRWESETVIKLEASYL